MSNILDELYQVIEARVEASPENSYSARLVSKGRAKIAQKIGEEATELVIEAIKDDQEAMISESADLLYHLTLLWVEAGIPLSAIADCLEARRVQSGIEEKQGRKFK